MSFSDKKLDGEFDLIVSAEGIHSSLRKTCYPDEETIIDHGVTT